jgi:hypothetical protein
MRRALRDASHGCDEAIAAPRHGLYAGAPRAVLFNDTAQRRYVHREVALLDCGSRPDEIHYFTFGNQLTRPLQQQLEEIKRSSADRDGLSRTRVIEADKTAKAEVEAKSFKQKNVARTATIHRLAFRLTSG